MSSVAVPKDTIWALEPHTAAKHKILACYLDAWFPILAKYNGRIVYLDGFSDPGRIWVENPALRSSPCNRP